MKKIIIPLVAVCLLSMACKPGDKDDPSTPADFRFVCDAMTEASVCDKPNARLLVWTAGGDDGRSGKALQYDIRWAKELITEGTFGEANQFKKEQEPKRSGTRETLFLPRLVPGRSISFGIRALDEVGRKSGITTTPMVTLNFLDVPLHFYRQCLDLIDNDGDTLIDESDPDCTSSLGGSEEFAPSGPVQPDYGAVVAVIGNVDKKAKRDIAVGAPGAISSVNGLDTGSVSLFFAVSRNSLIVEDGELPHTVDSTTPAVVIYGGESGDRFGAAVYGEGDFNGDGANDFVVGAPGAGKVYVFFGGGAGALDLGHVPRNPDVPLEAPAGDVADIIITGPPGNDFGAAVAFVGNVNGKKGNELSVGAPGAGRVYIFYGGLMEGNAITGTAPSSLDLNGGGWADWTLTGPGGSDFGYALNRVTSLKGSGANEIVIGAPGIESVFVFYGGTRVGKAIDFSLVGPQVWTYDGANFDLLLQGPAGGKFGAALGGKGVLFGSSTGSVVIGAPGVDTVYVIFGGKNGLIDFPTTGPVLHDVVTQGADLVMEGELGTRFGESLSIRSDLDGDGRSDVLVGVPYAVNSSALTVGAVYAFYSKKVIPPLRTVNDAEAVIWGRADNGRFGLSVSGTGNLVIQSEIIDRVYDDLIVGAPGANEAFLEF